MEFLYLIVILFVPKVFSDMCNPHATLIETDTFYLTQPFTKNVTIDISNYANTFPQLSSLVAKFKGNLENYSTEDNINSKEKFDLIPFTKELNAFILENKTTNTDSYRQCAQYGGSLVKITAKNRGRLVEILKTKNIEHTPIHTIAFHHLMTDDEENDILATPTDLDNLVYTFTKSPPWITKNNEIVMPQGPDDSKPETYKSSIVCTKPNNPWDLKQHRKKWYQMLPRIRNVMTLLDKMHKSYETATRSLRKVPTLTQQIADVFSLTIPDPLKNVLEFLTKFSDKSQWEKTKGDDSFKNFVNTALKLARQLNLNPNSITKIVPEKLKFSPPSINEFNWRESFNLDDAIYGIIGPVTVTPFIGLVPNNSVISPTLFEASITARVYNRQTDKITLYSVKPNYIHNEMAAIKTVVVTPVKRIALPEEAVPLQCEWIDTEQLKVCHKMSIQPVPDISASHLIKCAGALMSTKITDDFKDCPRIKAKAIPTLYRADCEPDHKATAIINSDSPLTLEFKCDGKHDSYKNITVFPTLITTPCEINIVEGTFSSIALPQWNADFLQDQGVDEVTEIETPPFDISDKMMLIVVACISIISPSVILIIALSMYFCIRCCKKRRNNPRPPSTRSNNDQQSPARLQEVSYYPAIQVQEFPFTN